MLHTHTAKAGTVGRVAARLAGSARPPVVVHTFHGHTLEGYFGPAKQNGVPHDRARARARDRCARRRQPRGARRARRDRRRAGVALRGRAARHRALRAHAGRRAGRRAPRLARHRRRTIHDRLGRPDDRREARPRRAAHAAPAARARHRRGARDGRRRPRPRRARGARARARDRRSATHFVGFQDDVGPWFHAFDALLLPSRNEGTPVSAIETLAAGRPVVASRVGGVPDVVARRHRRLPLSRRRCRRGRRACSRASPPTPSSAGGWASRAASGRSRATGCRGSSRTSTASTGHCSPERAARRGRRSGADGERVSAMQPDLTILMPVFNERADDRGRDRRRARAPSFRSRPGSS